MSVKIEAPLWRLIDLETELYGIQASTVYARELLSDLKCQKAEKQKADELLELKYGLIQQFETDPQYKQLVIQNLVKQNGGARLRLEQQKNEKHIHSLGNEVDAIVAGIEGRLVRELELFTHMRICQLKTAELECGLKMPCEDMSINRLENSSSNPARAAANAALNAVTFGLRFPSYLAPECLLGKIREFKEDVYDITAPSSVSQSDATKFDALLDRLANIEACLILTLLQVSSCVLNFTTSSALCLIIVQRALDANIPASPDMIQLVFDVESKSRKNGDF
eukprot:gene10769-11922_t